MWLSLCWASLAVGWREQVWSTMEHDDASYGRVGNRFYDDGILEIMKIGWDAAPLYTRSLATSKKIFHTIYWKHLARAREHCLEQNVALSGEEGLYFSRQHSFKASHQKEAACTSNRLKLFCITLSGLWPWTVEPCEEQLCGAASWWNMILNVLYNSQLTLL